MSGLKLEQAKSSNSSVTGGVNRWAVIMLLSVLSVVAIMPAAPFIYQTPDTDASIFLYVGREVAAGRLPYLQAYDHKPPLIFYLDAFGLIIGHGSRWGIWVIELFSLLATTGLAFTLLERYFGRRAAGIACTTMLVNLALVHQRGNLTEEYALPFQFGAIALLAGAERALKPGWRYFLLGVLLGLASSLKQPLAGVGLAIALFLFFKQISQPDWRRLIRNYAWIGAGGLLVWLFWFGLYLSEGIFPEFWEATFLINFGYSSFSTPERVQFLFDALNWMGNTSAFFAGGTLIWMTLLPFLLTHDRRVMPALTSRWVGIGGGVLGLFLLYNGFFRSGLDAYALNQLSAYRVSLIAAGLLVLLVSILIFSQWAASRLKKLLAPVLPDQESPITLPLFVAFIDLPVEIVMATLAGRNFPHYFMPLLPSLAILFGYAVYTLLKVAAPSPAGQVSAYAWLGALLVPVLIPGIIMTEKQMHFRNDRQVEDVAAYVVKNTLPSDPVMQWGITPGVYILSGRNSPTRFFHVNPIFFDGYSGSWHTQRLLADLTAAPPLLIIDAQMARLPLVLTPDGINCEKVKDPVYYSEFTKSRKEEGVVIPQMPQGIGEVYFWICENYSPVASVGELKWQVYRLKGK